MEQEVFLIDCEISEQTVT